MHKSISRRKFINYLTIGATFSFVPSHLGFSFSQSIEKPPNFIIIFCDDLGYGDIGCFGSIKHRTPNIDQMAKEGKRFTSFYVTSGVCTPSRASLMTGCYPRRVNLHVNEKNECVLFPVNKNGLHPNEITIAEILKTKGYRTACIGKWHLGDQKEFLPTRQGFDFYFGIPYSNDMGAKQREINPSLPLLRNEKVVEAPVDQSTVTKRYTEEVLKFIKSNKEHPFFVYLPHTMPHNPVNSSEIFKGKSANGGYGDAVEEIDWSTGEILKTLRKEGLDKNTLVIFTSDNGAAKKWGGSNLPLSGWKGTTMEGGMRVPCIMCWPGKIPAGETCNEITITMDFLPTFAGLAGAKVTKDRIIDGKDIWLLMNGQSKISPHEVFYYYQKDQLQAVRSGKWKLHLPFALKRRNWGKDLVNQSLALYDLETDAAEEYNLADLHPDIVEKLARLAEKTKIDLGDEIHQGKGQRIAGSVISPKPLIFEK